MHPFFVSCAGAALGTAVGVLLWPMALRLVNGTAESKENWRCAACAVLTGALSAATLSQQAAFPAGALALSALWTAEFHALTDLADGYIYDRAVIVSFCAALILRSFDGLRSMILEIALGAGAGWTPVALIIVLSRGGMGWGDASMMAGIGALIGWKLALLSLYVGFIVGGIAALLMLLMGRVRRSDAVPLAPFLAFGTALALIFGRPLFSLLGLHLS